MVLVDVSLDDTLQQVILEATRMPFLSQSSKNQTNLHCLRDGVPWIHHMLDVGLRYRRLWSRQGKIISAKHASTKSTMGTSIMIVTEGDENER